MNDVKYAFSVIMSILQHRFVVLGVSINLLSVIIGCGIIGLVLYFFFGVFDE